MKCRNIIEPLYFCVEILPQGVLSVSFFTLFSVSETNLSPPETFTHTDHRPIITVPMQEASQQTYGVVRFSSHFMIFGRLPPGDVVPQDHCTAKRALPRGSPELAQHSYKVLVLV